MREKVKGREYPDYGRVHDLTAEEIRACKVFAKFSDDEVQEVIDTLKRFAILAYESYTRRKQKQGSPPGNTST